MPDVLDLNTFKVIRNTVLLFAKQVFADQPLDYPFIDAASQKTLANLAVMSKAARNSVISVGSEQTIAELPDQQGYQVTAWVDNTRELQWWILSKGGGCGGV